MSVAGGRAAAGKLPTGVDAGGGPIPEPGKPALLWLLVLGALSLGINGLLRYRRAER